MRLSPINIEIPTIKMGMQPLTKRYANATMSWTDWDGVWYQQRNERNRKTELERLEPSKRYTSTLE